jgi:hypothetical protein
MLTATSLPQFEDEVQLLGDNQGLLLLFYQQSSIIIT